MRRVIAVCAIVLAAAGGTACSAGSAARARSGAAASLLVLHCPDSAGQQGQDHEVVVGGVEGLALPGSADPGGLTPIRATDGGRYFVYKAFLAVAAAEAPFATVSVTRPAGARLVYGSPSRIGGLAAGSGRGLVAAARRGVRLPVCGPRFTGYVGGVVLARPACVTFTVSSPAARPATVSVPIGPSRCPPVQASRA